MKNKIKLFWITGSNFYSVDEPLMSELNHIFDIFMFNEVMACIN
jgi:hypothetical protein